MNRIRVRAWAGKQTVTGLWVSLAVVRCIQAQRLHVACRPGKR